MSVGSYALPGVDAKVTIQKKGSTAYVFDGRITSYDKGDFEKRVEVINTQGYPLISKKPISPANISFGVLVDVDSSASSLSFSDIIGSSSNTSSLRKVELDQTNFYDYKVKLEFFNYVDTYGVLGTNDDAYKEVYYNAKGMRFDKKASEGDYLRGTFNFLVSPFNELGSSNYLELEKPSGVATGSYTSIETSKDSSMGY